MHPIPTVPRDTTTMTSRPHRRIGLIGHGRIGRTVAQAIGTGVAGAWEVVAILTRGASSANAPVHHARPDTFFAVPVDLYLECAGPQALAQLGATALQHADVWSVSGVALADDAVRAQVVAAGERHGHRLRLVAGAAGGLDAVQALALDPAVELEVSLVAPESCDSFSASTREAAMRLPHGVNLAVALALAGPGLDRTRVVLTADPDRTHHAIRVHARSRYGSFESHLLPVTDMSRGLHVVAASLLAALRQADSVVWVG